MAIKQVTVSDISGKDIEDDSAARIVVSDHPALGSRTVELDVDLSEVEKLQNSKLTMVSVAVYEPGQSTPQRIIMDAAAFDKLFKGDVNAILQNARSGGAAPPSANRTRRNNAVGVRNRSATAKKVDYTTPEHFGQLHRGRVTEEEAALVRDNIAQANKNRVVLGQVAIDVHDEKEKRRYGL